MVGKGGKEEKMEKSTKKGKGTTNVTCLARLAHSTHVTWRFCAPAELSLPPSPRCDSPKRHDDEVVESGKESIVGTQPSFNLS